MQIDEQSIMFILMLRNGPMHVLAKTQDTCVNSNNFWGLKFFPLEKIE